MSLDVPRSKGAHAPSHTEVQLIDHMYDDQASAQHVCDEIGNRGTRELIS